jgi:lysophospholipase L1-like esterase
MTKKAIGNLLLTCVALTFALAAAEFTVRLLYKDQTVLSPRYHTDYQYGRYKLRGVRPNTSYSQTTLDGSWQFVTNSRGFRNAVDFPYGKPNGAMRVLSLGDSQTQGHEVRQGATFSAVLENYLNAHNVHAEVLNTGVSGFSTAEQLAFLENEGYKYEPDVVVLGFFANDFVDNVRAGLFRFDGPDRLVPVKFEYIPGVRIQNLMYAIPGVRWLGENSYFYSVLFNHIWAFFKARSKRQAVESASATSIHTPASDAEFEFAVATRSKHSSYEKGLALALIDRMHAFCRERGIRFIVLDIPTVRDVRQFGSSLPSEMRDALLAKHVELITSDSLLKDFGGAVEIHVPHGTRHISEFTHALFGIELGRRILAARRRSSSSGH